MSQQIIKLGFPQGPFQYKAIIAQDTPYLDDAFNTNPQRSAGSTVIFPITLGPAINQRWSITSLSVQAYLGLCSGGQIQPSGGTPIVPDVAAALYGKFGRIFAAIDPSGDSASTVRGTPGGGGTTPWAATFVPVDSDTTLETTLWDQSVNELPPHSLFAYDGSAANPIPGPEGLLRISGAILPPNPIPLTPGMQPNMILSMLPSIVGASIGQPSYNGLTVYYGTYVVNYDDGL